MFSRQLSQICHHIRSLSITFNEVFSNGLIELILLQENLKDLELHVYQYYVYWADIIPALTKHNNTLTKLRIYGDQNIPLSFIASFINL